MFAPEKAVSSGDGSFATPCALDRQPATMRRLQPIALRDVPRSPDGGVIADYSGSVTDPAGLAAFLSATPGVVEHGLFPPELVHDVFIARGTDVEHRTLQ